MYILSDCSVVFVFSRVLVKNFLGGNVKNFFGGNSLIGLEKQLS